MKVDIGQEVGVHGEHEGQREQQRDPWELSLFGCLHELQGVNARIKLRYMPLHLCERLAQRAVRRRSLAVPSRVEQEDAASPPARPDVRLQPEQHVQCRSPAAHARAWGVGDDEVARALAGELSPRTNAPGIIPK